MIMLPTLPSSGRAKSGAPLKANVRHHRERPLGIEYKLIVPPESRDMVAAVLAKELPALIQRLDPASGEAFPNLPNRRWALHLRHALEQGHCSAGAT